MDSEDDETQLPADTLHILQQFLKEKAERENNEKILDSNDENINFEENWQLSQFWYSENTKDQVSEALKSIVNGCEHFKIALLSCPSLYLKVKNVHPDIKLFEFDTRFSVYQNDFVHYDYNEAHNEHYLKDHYSTYDLLIADPPFLSDECIEKMSVIVKKLLKPGGKILLFSGNVVAPFALKYMELTQCKYQPEHNRNLGNEFSSFANFQWDDFVNKS